MGTTSSSIVVDVDTELRMLRNFYGTTRAWLDLPDDRLFTGVETVSAWTPAQHLYHIWRANASMLKAAQVLATGRIDTQVPSLTGAGQEMLRDGKIPRGVAQAPTSVRPPANLDRGALEATLRRSQQKLDDVEELIPQIEAADEGGLLHPWWGTLTAAQWLRAARIHARHHEAILRDIEARREG